MVVSDLRVVALAALLTLAVAGRVVAAEGAGVPSANPLSGDAEAIQKGHELYVKWCQQCHGVEADGVSERFGDYAADLRRFWRGYYEFVGIVLQGVPEKQMPPWQGVLDADQISQIGAWLETKAMDGANWQ